MHILAHARPTVAPSRRAFLKGAAAGALVIGTVVQFEPRSALAASFKDAPMPNAFVRIAPDNTVTVIIKHLDKGQGVTTGLTTIVAEELEAAWSQMHFEFAPADAALYNNLLFGPVQGTGGSSSVANSWLQLRRAGAAARAMLVAAAAADWGVPVDQIMVAEGVLSAGDHTGTFGDFATKAAALPVPSDVRLKDPKDFKLIGTRLPRLDSVAKTTGAAIYSLDIRRPGMKTAVLMHPPRFGGSAKSFDAADAKKVPGVVEVVAIPQGVAVIADNTYAAIKGREALHVEWDDSHAETRSTDAIFADYR